MRANIILLVASFFFNNWLLLLLEVVVNVGVDGIFLDVAANVVGSLVKCLLALAQSIALCI